VSRRLVLVAAACAVLIGASVGSVGAQAPQFVLSGVLVVEGGGRAWLQEPSLTQNQIVSVRVGDSVGPYVLTKVLDDRVEMKGPSGPFMVRLAGGPGTASAPVPVAPPAPAPVAQKGPPPPPELPDPDAKHVVVDINMQGAPGPPVDFGALLRGLAPR
jgi:hypothetical protein